MWEVVKYVNNEWTLYAVIALAILIFLQSWLNKTKALIETLPDSDRASILRMLFLGRFLFQLLLIGAVIAGGIAIFSIIEKRLDSEISTPNIPVISNVPDKKECPDKLSDDLNAPISCLER